MSLSLGAPDNLTKETIAQHMFQLSTDSPYAQTQEQYKAFCHNAWEDTEARLFFIFLFYTQTAEKKPLLCGFLNGTILGEEAEIDFICVEKTLRKNGIANMLWAAFEQFFLAQKPLGVVKKIFLEVGATNQEALSFYEKKGLRKTTCRRTYYKSGEDAWNMEKALT